MSTQTFAIVVFALGLAMTWFMLGWQSAIVFTLELTSLALFFGLIWLVSALAAGA